MPAHMDSPLDVTHPSWYRNDGTARTIRSGVPSLRSTPSYSSSSSKSHPNSQPQSRMPSSQSTPPPHFSSSSISISTTTATSPTSSTRRARGPRAQPQSRSSRVDSPNFSADGAVQDRRHAAGEDGRLIAPVQATGSMSGDTVMEWTSQIKRNEQAARFRSFPQPRLVAVDPIAQETLSASSLAPSEIEQLRQWEIMHAQATYRAQEVASNARTPSHPRTYSAQPSSLRLVGSYPQSPVEPEYPPDPAGPLHDIENNLQVDRPIATASRTQTSVVHRARGDRRNHAFVPPRSKAEANIPPGGSWYRPGPPRPSVIRKKDKRAKKTKEQDSQTPSQQNKGWYGSIIGMLGSGKA
ncbi:hypothetical protein BDN70DRAFT_935091 [Pholiota conissans]|uniref:Uncharacterized protein n=1 Tax=Pholiota conissans TaxID=109636 RepID=A0A9P5YYV5_9AGAR|nr:hypothetical protein BDN70DRAFT_935091 [Pholiota conissans]